MCIACMIEFESDACEHSIIAALASWRRHFLKRLSSSRQLTFSDMVLAGSRRHLSGAGLVPAAGVSYMALSRLPVPAASGG